MEFFTFSLQAALGVKYLRYLVQLDRFIVDIKDG